MFVCFFEELLRSLQWYHCPNVARSARAAAVTVVGTAAGRHGSERNKRTGSRHSQKYYVIFGVARGGGVGGGELVYDTGSVFPFLL